MALAFVPGCTPVWGPEVNLRAERSLTIELSMPRQCTGFLQRGVGFNFAARAETEVQS